ncbi:electron transport complex subunit RsxC [Planctomycetota bacterium]
MTTHGIARKTFHGGSHPPESKELTAERRIHHGPAPKQVTLLLSQHIGAPCEPLVKKGDTVEAGQKVADNEAFVCAPIHSPVSGTVKEISLQPHAVLGRSPGMVIQVEEGSDQRPLNNDKFDADFDETSYSAKQICEAARNCGLVGMGGAGFPTRVKLEPNPRLPKDIIVINGCECEPYITCDYRVMMEWTQQVVAGIKLARQASGCQQVCIGIEDNKPKAITAITEAVRRTKNGAGIEVVPVKTKYPQGGERQLIKAVTGKDVPTGGIPPMIGVLVLNVATAAALAEATVFNTPLTHRVVTVTGEAIGEPGNYWVPLGVSVGELIDFCGGLTQSGAKVVLGGPMMGFAIADMGMPITKTSGAITVLTEIQIGKAKFERRETPCIRCGRCLEVCPENLNPTKIAHVVKAHALEIAQNYYINACMECGCCSYVCPANIEITGYIRTGKIFLARQKRLMPE